MFKKIFLIYFFSIVSLFSQDNLELNTTLSSKTTEDKLSYGVTLINNKEFKKALEFFEPFFEKEPDNPRVNYYIGMSYFGMGLFDESVAAYERVLIKEPNHMRARLELAISLFKSNQLIESEKELLYVKNSPNIPAKVLENIETLLIAIENLKKRNTLIAIFMFGINHDDNINNNSQEYFGKPLNETAQSDFISQKMINLNNSYDFGQLGGYTFESSLLAFFMDYNKYKEKDISLFSLSAGLTNKKQKTIQDFKLNYDKIYSDDKNLMNTYGATFKYLFNHSSDLSSTYAYSLKKNRFVDSNLDSKNSTVNQIDLGLNKILNKEGDSFGINSLFSVEKANKSAGNDKNNFSLSFKYNKNINKKLSITPSFLYKKVDYKEADVDAGKIVAKEEKQKVLSLAGSYKFKDLLIFGGNISYTDNDSNYDESVYEKYVIGTNVLYIIPW